jgi:membrane-associated phospholipid phosphatase
MPVSDAVTLFERMTTTADGSLDRRPVLRTVLGGYVVFAATYLPINHSSIGREAAILFLPGEERLPFVPEFEYLYVLTYVLPLLLVPCLPDARRLARTTVAFGLILAVAYATYLLFPVYFERPRLEVHSLATFLLALEYLDPSYNHFPSLHVAISWLVFLACRDRIRRPRAFLLLVVGISLSTLFVKQHYLVDVLYGAALAGAAWWAAGRWLAGRWTAA